MQLREEPTLQTHISPSMGTSFLDLLTTDSPNIEKITQTFTSTDNIQSIDIISSTDKSSSKDIPHPLTVPNPSTNQSMDSPTELINQVLLGMREGSEFQSEGQARDLAKGEDMSERTPTSSGGTKGEVEGTTLAVDEKGEDLRDVRFQDEILMKTVRETGYPKDLTSISIDEQMQIANSMGIEVGGAYKDEQYAAELTQEMELSSGGDKEDSAEEARRIAEGGLPNFNLNPETFQNANTAYQQLASSSNKDVEQLLGLIHTEGSILHANESLKSIPEVESEEERDFYEGEGGFVDSMSTYEDNENDWPQDSSSFSLADDAQDLEAKYKASMEAPEPEDPISKKIAQFYKDTLKIQKLQNAGLQSSIKSLRNEFEATRDKKRTKMDARHPLMTSKLILDKLKKESPLEITLKDLTQRMTKVEANLQLVLQNQVTQTEILAKLIFTRSGEISLSFDDNKKGEKEQKEKVGRQQINEDQQIKEAQRINETQRIKKPQQISSQHIISRKRKTRSTSDQPTSKR